MVGVLANSSLPSIEVVPPRNGSNTTWSALLMTLEVDAPSLLPFIEGKQRLLTGLVIQAGSMFIELQLLATHSSCLFYLLLISVFQLRTCSSQCQTVA